MNLPGQASAMNLPGQASAMNPPGQGQSVRQSKHQRLISYELHQEMSFPQYLSTLRNIDDFGAAKLAKLFGMKKLSGSMKEQVRKWKTRRFLAQEVCKAVYAKVSRAAVQPNTEDQGRAVKKRRLLSL